MKRISMNKLDQKYYQLKLIMSKTVYKLHFLKVSKTLKG